MVVFNVSEDRSVQNGDKPENSNPFSFKRFLQNSAPAGGARPKTGGSLTTLDLANDLPDFVQGHFTMDDHRPRPRVGHFTDSSLPDFALDSDGSKLGVRQHLSSDCEDGGEAVSECTVGVIDSRRTVCGSPDNVAAPAVAHESLDIPSVICVANPSGGGLPDFLSDSAIGHIDGRSSVDRGSHEDITSSNGFLSDDDMRFHLQKVCP